MQFLINNIWLVLLVAVSGFFLILDVILRRPREGITPAQATQLINHEHAVIVDFRSAEEFSAGHIQKSRHILLDQLPQQITSLQKAKNKPVILVNANGHIPAATLKQFNAAGFTRTFVLQGGIAEWKNASLPIIKTK